MSDTPIEQRLRERVDINEWHDAGLIDGYLSCPVNGPPLRTLILEGADRIAELERKAAHLKRCWFLAMGYDDIPDESPEQVLTRKVAEQRTAMDALERKSARWDECKSRYLVRNGMGEFLSSPYLEPNADAAIDAAIEQREKETTT